VSHATLHLHLIDFAGSFPSQGQSLNAIEPTVAKLREIDDGVRVDVRLPQASVAEQRWCVDQVCRKICGAFELGPIRLSFDVAIAKETALTLALDRHLSSRGDLEILDEPEVSSRLAQVAPAVDRYAQWVDEDPTVRTSLTIAKDVTEWCAQRDDVTSEVLDAEQLEALGMNLMIAVGGASTISPPRLVIARYLPEDPRPPLMLLGKGITFDTGGINVKPYESFVSMMKNDMGGAALAWALFAGLVDSGIDQPLLVVLPTCENPIGEGAMRPGSVVKSYSGQTVRIDHTDAEGRLVLADALSYATERYEPDQVICFATLTTAALIAYGPYATPVHFATPLLQAALEDASTAMGEDLHFFPRRLWHREANRDHEADLKNTGCLPKHAVRGAGSRNAAHFLAFFTETPLVHLDIFASTWNWAGDAPGAGPGATGAPLRTLLRALSS
jgi:leucyl aminopeptidase